MRGAAFSCAYQKSSVKASGRTALTDLLLGDNGETTAFSFWAENREIQAFGVLAAASGAATGALVMTIADAKRRPAEVTKLPFS